MARLRVHTLARSVDGFVAGPDQSVDNPLGVGGEDLHTWMFATRSGRRMIGEEVSEIPGSRTLAHVRVTKK